MFHFLCLINMNIEMIYFPVCFPVFINASIQFNFMHHLWAGYLTNATDLRLKLMQNTCSKNGFGLHTFFFVFNKTNLNDNLYKVKRLPLKIILGFHTCHPKTLFQCDIFVECLASRSEKGKQETGNHIFAECCSGIVWVDLSSYRAEFISDLIWWFLRFLMQNLHGWRIFLLIFNH